MELVYIDSKGEQIRWAVEELQAGVSYRLVDQAGGPTSITVKASENRSVSFHSFDGFVIEGDDVYCVTLLTPDHKVKVGSAPQVV